MGAPVKAVPNYDELIASKEVDAVYIPLPTGARKEWVLKAAAARKHVVCEKPCAVNLADVRLMIDTCRANRVQFMDGVMFMHSARLEKIRAELESQNFGQLKRITSAFSFRGDEAFFANNIRMNSALEPFGALGDLGWYCIRLALWTMKEQLPTHVTGRILREAAGKDSAAPVATEFSGELLFANGVSSGFYCSFDSADEQWAILTGTDGLIRLEDFVLPFFGNELAFETINADLKVTGCDFNMEPNRRRIVVPEYSNSHTTAQETNLFRDFAAQVLSGKLNEEWPQIALKTQEVMESCLDSARNGNRCTKVVL
jgi:predicted dehydrogenase